MCIFQYFSSVFRVPLRALCVFSILFPSIAFTDCEVGDGRPICNQCQFKRMVEADWAMLSSESVTVDYQSNIRFISFIPNTLPAKNTGLAIFHGGDVDWSAYSPMAHWAAEAGYKSYLVRLGDDGTACVAPPVLTFYPQIDDFLDQNAGEVTQWVFAGHSLGGVLASGYMENRQQQRSEVQGISYWASYTNFDLSPGIFDFLSGSNILGSRDAVATWPEYIVNAVNLPDPTQTKCIMGGNHARFGWYGPQTPDDEAAATISREEQQAQIRQHLLTYLDTIENNLPYPADDNTAETESCQDIFKEKG